MPNDTGRVSAVETYRHAVPPESRTQVWEVNAAAGFLAAEVGVAVVAFMAWLVLFCVR